MYHFPVKDLYIVDTVTRDARAAARTERLRQAMGVSSPIHVTRAQLGNAPIQWTERPRCTGSFDFSEGRTVVLDTYQQEGDTGRHPLPLCTYRDAAKEAIGGGVCQSALELHCALGCYHRCAYCFTAPCFHIACDLERLAESLPARFAEYPAQQLWKFDNLTDTITLEPEYGASELLVPRFGETEDRYLLLYTKSDNIEHLLDLPHRGHTLINWSLSTPTQSRELELDAPDPSARIDAMRRCREAGYTVRIRLSPIVPIKGWRDELPALLEALFATVDPDVVTVDVLGWVLAEGIADAMDISMLEPAFQEVITRLIEEGSDYTGKYLFPHDLRLSALRFAVEQVRRCSPRTPVAICNETPRMWNDLADLLSMKQEQYVCCCGPDSVPPRMPRYSVTPTREEENHE